MSIAVVTGASSGIGQEFVNQIAQNYKSINEIWVIARRKERLILLKEQTEEKCPNKKIRPIAIDVTDAKQVEEYSCLLRKNMPSVKILVNAAGYGMIGSFDELSLEDNVGMCDLNCKALTFITKVTLPYMNRSRSYIINLASAAAFVPQPSFAVYAASKSYVLSLSRALKKELSKTKIGVTAVCPGPVNTEFFDIAETYNKVKIYKKMFRADAKDVVTKALNDTLRNKDVSVYGKTMQAFNVLCKLLPHKFIMSFIK